MGCAISHVAYGPDKKFASQNLIVTLQVCGYEVEKFESTDFVWIHRYGKYKFVFIDFGNKCIRAGIERVGDFWEK